ncbi:hypothetical protein EYZ11_001166 [Aspergillus tanneri]|uniref:Uncharacterized protein n=1 Tax=Aspergillus tanneri TaxID=1220188 RepID=A0A4S3JV99_9EURO|nr:hypothetical protein EYZ11_001166 [Aspergillus tanneri]
MFSSGDRSTRELKALLRGFGVGDVSTDKVYIGEVIGDQTFLGIGFIAYQANHNIFWIRGEVLELGVAQPSTCAGDEIGGHSAGLDEH